ncbi:MAG: DNA-3-methyladenine glycosylase I, partial [Actinobacteria bacterium]|nr:DNA-3-methyladenine glycosylase I [Actinomycetota bacterium]
EIVARYDARDVERLLGDGGIVRNRAKIEAAISNARATLALREAGSSLPELVWSFAPPVPPEPVETLAQLPSQTPESFALAKALKTAGFRFVGPITAYAAMQACGVVNDHLAGCPVRESIAA